MALFNHREFAAANVFQKMLRLSPKENFLVELENLFADYENSLDSLTVGRVSDIAAKYKVDLKKVFLDERREFLCRVIDRALDDNCVDDAEYKLLVHFADLLCLEESVLEHELTEKSSAAYRKKLESVFSGEYISEAGKTELECLRKNIRLDAEKAKSIYREAVKSTMDSYTKPIFESEVYSPEDEARMFNAAKNLGLSLSFPPEIQQKLCKYRQNWEILNGKLPVLKSDMHLQAGEVLHHVQQVNWYEERTETTRVNYSGFSYSAKVFGNLRYRAGSIKPQKITQDVWRQIDSGQLFLTSKRIIFSGAHGNKVIPYGKVLHFEAYSNGIQIQKDSGKSPFLEFSGDVPVFAEILNQLIGRN